MVTLHLQKEDYTGNSLYFKRLLGRLNKFIYVKHLKECLAHSKSPSKQLLYCIFIHLLFIYFSRI